MLARITNPRQQNFFPSLFRLYIARRAIVLLVEVVGVLRFDGND